MNALSTLWVFENTHKPYCHMTTNVLYLVYNNNNSSNERRLNDGARATSISQRTGVESVQKETEKERVFLCSEMETRRHLPLSRITCRKTNRSKSTREARKSSLKEIKPATSWQVKSKTLAALWLPLNRPGKLKRDNHCNALSMSMIPDLAKKCKILCIETWACDRKKHVCS